MQGRAGSPWAVQLPLHFPMVQLCLHPLKRLHKERRPHFAWVISRFCGAGLEDLSIAKAEAATLAAHQCAAGSAKDSIICAAFTLTACLCNAMEGKG